MQQEIEVKFLKVSHDEVRARLKAAGAVCEQPMRLMRRQMFDYPDGRFRAAKPGKKLRLRDEGDKLTVTYKETQPGSSYAHEVETTVGSFETMSQLLRAIGLEMYSEQESKRETWHFGEVEVVLDEWPWLEPYIEIEGPSEVAIQAAAKALDFDWADAKFGSVDTAYRAQYSGIAEDDSVNSLPEMRFNAPLPQFLKDRMQ